MQIQKNSKKKIAIIGTVGVPANYGGFETLTEHLIENMAPEYDITVYCSGKKYKKEERKASYKNAKLKYIPLDANGIQSIPYDSLSIIHALFYADVLLVLGVAGAWILPFVRLFTNKKIIISIDGIEWKRDKWNMIAKWYLFWAESLAVNYSHIDIPDNEAIQDYTAARYGSLSRIIEYGADHTLKISTKRSDLFQYSFLDQAYAFKVCRIEPENNVHIILEAFSKFAKFPLVIVGNWDKSDYGKNLKAQYKGHSNLHLLDPIYNQQKLDVIRSNASLYVHGHTAGGTNPSLVEAMHLGLPILAYGVSYNRVTTENKALYFYTQNDLLNQLQNIHLEEIKKIGVKMDLIAQRRYTWSIIAEKYAQLIAESLIVTRKPSVFPDLSSVSYEKLLHNGAAHFKTNQLF